MAKARYRRRSVVVVRRGARRAAKMTIPVAVVAGFTPLLARAIDGWRGNGVVGVGDGVLSGLTGYSVFDHKWHSDIMLQNLGPIVAGFGVHWLAGRLGINRALSRAKVPLLRI